MRFWRKHPVVSKIILMSIVIFLIVTIFIRKTLVPIFFTLAEAQAVNMTNKIISEVVSKEVEDIDYKDLITYDVNQNGDIILMQPNVREINKFSAEISLSLGDNLEELNDLEILIPFLRILGFDLLAGMGPNIRAKIIPVGFVHPPEVIDSFESAGINQTRHKIYLQVDVNLRLIVPFSQKTIQVSSDLQVIDVTILGKVPEVYVGINGEGISGIIGSGN